jgi:small subunit ribosomal protein S20
MATGQTKKIKPRKKSVLKNIRAARRRAAFNRANLTRVRGAIRKMRAAIASGDRAAAQSMLSGTYSELDRAIRKGALRENTANRYKSRIALSIGAMKA